MKLGFAPDRIGRWVLGAVGVVVFLLGLLVASLGEGEFSNAGLFAALFSLLLVFWQIKRAFDAYDADPDRPRKPAYAPPVQPMHGTPPKLPTDHNPDAHKPFDPPQHVFEGGWARPRRAEPDGWLSGKTGGFVKGGLLAVLAVLALYVAAGGTGWSYYGGIAVAIGAVLAIFRMIAGEFGVPQPPAGQARWVVGGLVGVAALVLLYIASVGDGARYYVGLMLALGLVLYLFTLIKSSFDEAEGHGHGHES